MPHGIGFDHILASDHAITGLLPAEDADRAAIDIRWQPALAASRTVPPIWSRDGDALCFAPPGVAHYRCTASRIEIAPLAGADRDMVEALLIATALPAAMWLGGGFLLHAAAVVPARRAGALAIAGVSGSGKSRLAAEFLARGADLVADDSITLCHSHDATAGDTIAGDAIICAGLAGGYHLGTDGAGGRIFHPVPPERARRSAPLAALVVLADAISRTRLTGTAAVAALLGNRHRASVPRHCGREPQSLRDAAHFARAIPVYTWPVDEADALLDDALCRDIMREEDTE